MVAPVQNSDPVKVEAEKIRLKGELSDLIETASRITPWIEEWLTFTPKRPVESILELSRSFASKANEIKSCVAKGVKDLESLEYLRNNEVAKEEGIKSVSSFCASTQEKIELLKCYILQSICQTPEDLEFREKYKELKAKRPIHFKNLEALFDLERTPDLGNANCIKVVVQALKLNELFFAIKIVNSDCSPERDTAVTKILDYLIIQGKTNEALVLCDSLTENTDLAQARIKELAPKQVEEAQRTSKKLERFEFDLEKARRQGSFRLLLAGSSPKKHPKPPTPKNQDTNAGNLKPPALPRIDEATEVRLQKPVLERKPSITITEPERETPIPVKPVRSDVKVLTISKEKNEIVKRNLFQRLVFAIKSFILSIFAGIAAVFRAIFITPVYFVGRVLRIVS